MDISLHSRGVAQGFSDVARTYDAWAEPHRRMAARLVELLPGEIPSGLVMDLGCGTGGLTKLLHARYPDALVLGIDIASGMIDICHRRWRDVANLRFEVADAEDFRAPEPCALIASSSTFQWFQRPAETIEKLAQTLKPDGLLAVSVPIEGSLFELWESYQAVTGKAIGGIEMLPSETYAQFVNGAGLRMREEHVENIETCYGSAWDVLRYFKGVGATFRRHDGYAPLPVPATRKLVEEYGRMFARGDGRVPVTYRMLYFVAEVIS